jgi:hypothetical protein
MTIEPPRREVVVRAPCLCVMEHPGGGKDRCCGWAHNPDYPFCYDCEQAEHPESPFQVGGLRR